MSAGTFTLHYSYDQESLEADPAYLVTQWRAWFNECLGQLMKSGVGWEAGRYIAMCPSHLTLYEDFVAETMHMNFVTYHEMPKKIMFKGMWIQPHDIRPGVLVMVWYD